MVIAVVATVVGSAASLVEVVTAFLIFPPQPGLTGAGWRSVVESRRPAAVPSRVVRFLALLAGWLTVCRCGLLCWSGPTRCDAPQEQTTKTKNERSKTTTTPKQTHFDQGSNSRTQHTKLAAHSFDPRWRGDDLISALWCNLPQLWDNFCFCFEYHPAHHQPPTLTLTER